MIKLLLFKKSGGFNLIQFKTVNKEDYSLLSILSNQFIDMEVRINE